MLVRLPQQPLVLQDGLKSNFGAVHKEAGGTFGLSSFPRAVWKAVVQQRQSEVAADRLVKMLSVELQKMLCWCLENSHAES